MYIKNCRKQLGLEYRIEYIQKEIIWNRIFLKYYPINCDIGITGIKNSTSFTFIIPFPRKNFIPSHFSEHCVSVYKLISSNDYCKISTSYIDGLFKYS